MSVSQLSKLNSNQEVDSPKNSACGAFRAKMQARVHSSRCAGFMNVTCISSYSPRRRSKCALGDAGAADARRACSTAGSMRERRMRGLVQLRQGSCMPRMRLAHQTHHRLTARPPARSPAPSRPRAPAARAPRAPAPRAAAARAAPGRSTRADLRAAAGAALPEALLFDCDGVIVDTEKDGHRVSFNEAFKRKGACWIEANMCDSTLNTVPCGARPPSCRPRGCVAVDAQA